MLGTKDGPLGEQQALLITESSLQAILFLWFYVRVCVCARECTCVRVCVHWGWRSLYMFMQVPVGSEEGINLPELELQSVMSYLVQCWLLNSWPL